MSVPMHAAQLTATRLLALAVVLASDHQDAEPVWAIFGPAAGRRLIGTSGGRTGA